MIIHLWWEHSTIQIFSKSYQEFAIGISLAILAFFFLNERQQEKLQSKESISSVSLHTLSCTQSQKQSGKCAIAAKCFFTNVYTPPHERIFIGLPSCKWLAKVVKAGILGTVTIQGRCWHGLKISKCFHWSRKVENQDLDTESWACWGRRKNIFMLKLPILTN